VYRCHEVESALIEPALTVAADPPVPNPWSRETDMLAADAALAQPMRTIKLFGAEVQTGTLVLVSDLEVEQQLNLGASTDSREFGMVHAETALT